MVVSPNSRIILLKSPLKLDNYNQITFNNSGDQFSYFYNLPKIEEWNYSYNRKDGVIRVSTDGTLDYEDLLRYNYCMYQNTHYDNKWFYAFITGVKYVNDGMTEVSIETDVFQTWQFDIVYKQSFIEREHVSNDAIGLHTYPEGLECGEYVINATGDVETNLQTTELICIGTSWLPDNTPFATQNRVYAGVFSGVYYILFKFTESAAKFVQGMADVGHANDIVNLFMIPLSIANVDYTDGWSTGTLGNQTGINFRVLPNSAGVITLRDANITLSTPATINGYTPRNNKLFCYPYNVLSISNNVGIQAEFRYEDFINNTPIFSLVAAVSPSCSVWLYPNNYKKNNASKGGYNWGIPVAKYPQGSWNGDMYTNWMTQNGVNIMGTKIDAPTSHAIMGSLQALTGAATGSLGSAGGGLGAMFGAITEQYRASMIPNQIGGQVNSGDVCYAFNKMSPTYYKMTIKDEYARIIDDFFTLYGYKVNDVSIPNIHKRSNWDYMKCINVNLEGDIPEADMDKIRGLFNNGCTFWHTTSQFLNYSATNSIL